MLFKPCIVQGRPLFCQYSSKKHYFCSFLFFFSCTLVKNLLLTALFVLSFVFSSLRQLTKTGRFIHTFSSPRSLNEAPCKREYGSTDASLLGRSDRRKPKYYLPQEFSTCHLENLRGIFETNFFGVIQTTQELLPLLRKSEQASIINISSEVGSLTELSSQGGKSHRDKFHAYGSSKTALNAFTVMLANELREDGISVNSITPGHTATDLNQSREQKLWNKAHYPL